MTTPGLLDVRWRESEGVDARYAAALADAVIVERTRLGLTAQALKQASGLSARTLRDIESATTTRRYTPATLAALDAALGWEEGKSWGILRGRGLGLTLAERDQIALELQALRVKVEEILERPPWLAELGAVSRTLTPDERRFVLDVAYAARNASPEARRAVLAVLGLPNT